MPPKLVDHLKRSLAPEALLDPSLRAGVERSNPWALYCAWVADWVLAGVLVAIAANAWGEFFDPLGLRYVPAYSESLLSNYLLALQIVLVPLTFACLQFVALALHSRTFGMRLFRHSVDTHGLRSQALYALGATVSLAALGLPVLKAWIDPFAGTETTSEEYQRWALHYVPAETAAPINLLSDVATSDDVPDWKHAA